MLMYVFYITDEKITESDIVNLKDNKDSFLQMTSVKAITLRSAQRGVISEVSERRVVECLEKDGHKKATGTCLTPSRHCLSTSS